MTFGQTKASYKGTEKVLMYFLWCIVYRERRTVSL